MLGLELFHVSKKGLRGFDNDWLAPIHDLDKHRQNSDKAINKRPVGL